MRQDVCLALLSIMGCDQKLIKSISGYYVTHTKRIMVDRLVGNQIQAISGFIQGCAISVLIINCVFAVWAVWIMARVKEIKIKLYIDDAKMYQIHNK